MSLVRLSIFFELPGIAPPWSRPSLAGIAGVNQGNKWITNLAVVEVEEERNIRQWHCESAIRTRIWTFSRVDNEVQLRKSAFCIDINTMCLFSGKTTMLCNLDFRSIP